MMMMRALYILVGTLAMSTATNPNKKINFTVQCKMGMIAQCREQILSLDGVSILHELGDSDMYAITIPKNLIDTLMAFDSVVSCHKNEKRANMPAVSDEDDDGNTVRKLSETSRNLSETSRNLKQLPSFGIDYVNARGVWNLPNGRGTRGAGAKVCVVEDGIATGHDDLDYNKIKADSAMLGTGAQFEHGVRVAGVISAQMNEKGTLGIAPDATIIGVEWDKAGGDPDSSDVIDALRECKEKGADIVTFSVGGFRFSPEESKYCQEMVDAGIVLVGASGNFHNNPRYAGHTYYPANYDSVITVGSINWSGKVSYFSSQGDSVDLVAPGENVRLVSRQDAATPTVVGRGTSFAAPLVAGAAALLKSLKPDATPMEIREALMKTATRPSEWTAGQMRDDAYGAGTINVLKAAEYILDKNANNIPTTVHINFDQWPGETLFDVLDSNNATVMTAGPFPFSHLSGYGRMKNTHHEWNLPRGCYTLVMKDLADDGICCKYGSGSFYVDYGGKRQVDTTFSSKESRHQFGDCGPVIPVCGNGKLEGDEECDDGNTRGGDGCSATCRVEKCGNGRKDVGEECDDGNTSNGDGCSATCHSEVCGNGRVDFGEECDDGNRKHGDGCSAQCEKEVCGNGRVDFGEECDDNNTRSGDGCSSKCEKEICGNGRIDFGEECDDKNARSGDGCSNKCEKEICGNGRIDFGEECDDSNTKSGDGCSDTCLEEVCGNGRIDFGEECDDGDDGDGDGCSAKCLKEECGNGRVDHGEECDDGNTAAGDGCSSVCKKEIVQVSSKLVKVDLRIKLDQYFSETSWNIKDSNGKIVGSGGGYKDDSTVYKSYNLPDGCYDLNMFDSYGDGLCCSGGVGQVRLTYNGKHQIRDLGFRSSSKTFKFGSCGDEKICPANLYFRIHTDHNSDKENKIKLENIDTGKTEMFIDANLKTDKTLYLNQCVQTHQCYKLTFTDVAGDGISRRSYSGRASVPIYSKFNDNHAMSIGFDDKCKERCVYLGSCKHQKCEPTGCSDDANRRLRGNMSFAEDEDDKIHSIHSSAEWM